MAIIRSNYADFPSRPPKINWNHPFSKGNGLRYVAVPNADGSVTELLTGKTYNWASAAYQGGGVTANGPVAYPATTTPGGIQIPAVITSEVFAQHTLAAIFSPKSLNAAQAIVSITSTTNGLYVYPTTGALRLSYAGVSLFTNWPNLIPGHLYAIVASSRWSTGGNPRDWGWCVDLTTGQAYYSSDNGGAGTLTGNSSYAVITTSGGATGDGRFYAGALSVNAITPEQQLEWLLNDPWGLWYANDVGPTMGFPMGNAITTGLSVFISGGASGTTAGVAGAKDTLAISGGAATLSAGTVKAGETNQFSIPGVASATATGSVAVTTTGASSVSITGAASATAANVGLEDVDVFL